MELTLDGIRYYILGDMETVNVTGEKTAYMTHLILYEAIAMNGGLNRTVDRKNIMIHGKFPEGIKTARLDLTRRCDELTLLLASQNGDIIYLNTNGKSINGFGKNLQTLTTGVSLLTTVMSVYLILTSLIIITWKTIIQRRALHS